MNHISRREGMRVEGLSRRSFLKRAAATCAVAGAPLILPGRALGLDGTVAPGNRIAVGCIGLGPQGNGVMGRFLSEKDARVVAVCDVNSQRLEETQRRVNAHYGDEGCATYGDFRELVARQDIDVVLVASPDHWHVLHALYAVRAGKDVYVEKPLGISLTSEMALRQACHDYGRLFQFGTQQRSSREFLLACELVRNGRIGELRTIHVAAPPSIQQPVQPLSRVPDWLDFEMWLGPAPSRQFFDNLVRNEFWWHNSTYAVGFISGWGIHHIDIAQWGNGTDLTGPVEFEGRGVFPADGFADCALNWNIEARYANGVRLVFTDDVQRPHGITFEGSSGWVHVHRGFIDAKPKALLKTVFGPNDLRLYASAGHVRNLLDCVKSRANTVSPIDVAVRSDTICLVSDIATRLRRPLKWDPAAERFVGDDEANRMLTRAMRAPWRV